MNRCHVLAIERPISAESQRFHPSLSIMLESRVSRMASLCDSSRGCGAAASHAFHVGPPCPPFCGVKCSLVLALLDQLGDLPEAVDSVGGAGGLQLGARVPHGEGDDGDVARHCGPHPCAGASRPHFLGGQSSQRASGRSCTGGTRHTCVFQEVSRLRDQIKTCLGCLTKTCLDYDTKTKTCLECLTKTCLDLQDSHGH